ncbi:MAG: hypothetical protein Q7K54_00180 [Candidatus Parcubacteria bacterium]|nr:hypothetical protein [Candidatus Parcubacteria bacterium]
MKIVNLMRKIGKYGRPIFWSLSFSSSLWLVSKFFYKLFFGQLASWGFKNNFFFILSVLMILAILFLSLYRITHPYISKEDYDSVDDAWGMGIFVLIIFVILQIFLEYLFNFNLYHFISNSNYKDLNI